MQSDDGVPITILDLPGVADAENKGTETNFDELTRAHVTNCDLVFWVSDVQTAFLTTHEKNEFEGINALLKQTTTETGTLYQIGILISKYNYGDTIPVSESEPQIERTDEITSDEITSDDEDTTVHDCYRRVEHIFENSGMPLFKYNAFGRILASNDKESQLVRLVQKTGVGALPVNTEFNLKWATDDLDDKQQLARLTSLLTHHMPDYFSLQCRLGYKLHQESCSGPQNCGCTNACICYCEYHGSCQWGSPKYFSATCSHAAELAECKYHRTDRCFFDKQLDEKCVPHCPQHARHSCTPASIAGKITSHKALDLLLDFFLIADEKDRENFNTTSAQFGMQPIMAYGKGYWSSFVQCLGKLPALCPLVEKRGSAILEQRSTHILHRLTKLLGPDFSPVARLYLMCTSKGNADGAAAPKTITVIDPEKHPQIFQLDIEFQNNRAVSCRKDWLARMRNARVQLWICIWC